MNVNNPSEFRCVVLKGIARGDFDYLDPNNAGKGRRHNLENALEDVVVAIIEAYIDQKPVGPWLLPIGKLFVEYVTNLEEPPCFVTPEV